MNIGTQGVWRDGVTLLMGVVVGVGAGVLLAPRSGSRTRRQLRNFAEDVGERAVEVVNDARLAVHRAIGKGKRLVA